MSISIHDIWLFCDHGKKIQNLPPSIIWLYPFNLKTVEQSTDGYNVWNILGPLGPVAEEEASLEALVKKISEYKQKIKEELSQENQCIVIVPSKASPEETYDHLDMALEDLVNELSKTDLTPIYVNCPLWKEYDCFYKDKTQLRGAKILKKFYTVNIHATDIGFLTPHILNDMALTCTKNDCCAPYNKQDS